MLRSKGNSGLIRHGKYDLKTVLDWMEADSPLDTDHQIKKFEGLDVLSGLLGYKVFKYKGSNCCCCPVQGEYFALEKTPGKGRNKYNNWHFNLYGKDSFGREVMITKDHITARSKGGSNELSNLQPMCIVCNMSKGPLHMKEFEAAKQGKSYDWNLDHANHVIGRLKERYGIDMTLEEYPEFLGNVIMHSEVIHNVSTSKSYRRVRFKSTDVYAVYSSLYKTIYTVLDPNTVEDKKKEVPHWGKGREKECKELFDTIHKTIIEQFKEFPTQRETAEYLKTCKYSTLMMAHWKGKHSRLNILAWEVVKSTLKITHNEHDKNRLERNSNSNVSV